MNIDHAIEAARADLATTENRIAQLETACAEMLERDDYVGAASKLAREIEAARTVEAAHRQRLVVLQARQQKVEHERREQERVSAISAIRKLLPARAAAAAKLDRALGAVSAAIAELEAADKAVFHGWSGGLPPAHSLKFCSVVTAAPLSTTRREVPLAPGLLRNLLEKLPLWDFSGDAARANKELIDELERTPLVEHEEAA
jgi:hypothetical protein